MARPRQQIAPAFNVFSTSLGWMALVGDGATLWELTFGHATPQAAVGALRTPGIASSADCNWNAKLAQRLAAYARGQRDDFRDVPVRVDYLSPAQQAVVRHCRRIPYGKTLTYGELAEQAGLPRAARFVGNCMAGNWTPLIIPCHRVVPVGGRFGRYSAPAGPAMKQHLLALESGAEVTWTLADEAPTSAGPRPRRSAVAVAVKSRVARGRKGG